MVGDLKNNCKDGASNESASKNVLRIFQNNPKKIEYLNFGEEDQMEIIGYKPDRTKNYVTWFFFLLTLGILRLLYHWYPHWNLLSTHAKCSLKNAKKVLIIDVYKGRYKSYFVKNVKIIKPNRERDVHSSMSSIISTNGCIYSKDQEKKQLSVYLNDGSKKCLEEARIINCKKITYIWDQDKQKFVKLSGLDRNVNNSELHSYVGYSKEEQTIKRITYGFNEINVPVRSILTLLVLEALTPFYIFQVFSLIVWFAELYYYYTVAIILMSIFGISTSILQTRKNQQNLKGTVHKTDTIKVSRGGDIFEEIPTTHLVPGDLIEIPSHGCEIQCDAVLLKGTCIVNESMLTGESVPVTKTALPNNSKPYNAKEDNNHTLYSGTAVIQTRSHGNQKVLAVVIRTGYLTTKGELVRSILYPPPADFKFDQDSYKFIAILAIISVLGFAYTFFSKTSRHISFSDTLIKALDLFTIAIPPALPAAMTVGKLYALNRLKKKKVFCINSRVINVSGSVDCICFDKTGTLTEDGLDMWGVVPVENHAVGDEIKIMKLLPHDSNLFKGMLTCHSISIINDELCGDPLDVKMFESTDWNLEEPSNHENNHYIVKPKNTDYYNSEVSLEMSILHQFQFSSRLQRMSVITKDAHSQNHQLFCKGAPEMVMSLSRNDTIPKDIEEHLKVYTDQGYRVIGMAYKDLGNEVDLSKLHREDVERDLVFVGLIILENRLKPQTTSVIKTLKEAGMKVVMVTGDNIQTAVSVAKECNLIDSNVPVIEVQCAKPTKNGTAQMRYRLSETLAVRNHNGVHTNEITTKNYDIEKQKSNKYQLVVTGTSWGNILSYYPHLIPKVVARGVVFARMSGQQKQQLIEELQHLGYYVAMCGDGSNDCSALKAAHVGVSLSEADASVASPFTSKEANISCVPNVIKQGRGALVTSFGVFKMMLCYSLAEFTSVIVMYTIDANLASLQFLYIDVCLLLLFASFFGKTEASEYIHKEPPMTSMLSFIPLTSIIAFMVSTVTFQILAFWFIQTYDWFIPYVNHNDNVVVSYENYAVFSLSIFQYVTMAVVFSKGYPYRKPIYTNTIFMCALIIMTAINAYIVVYPARWVIDLLELQVAPDYFPRVTIVIFALANFLVCITVEDFFIEYLLKTKIKPYFYRVEKSNKLFKHIEIELNSDWSWPLKEPSSSKKCDNNSVICDSLNETVSGRKRSVGVANNGFQSDSGKVENTKC